MIYSSNVRQGDVADLDIVVPLVEQLDVADLLNNILGKDVRDDLVLDLDIATVRHFGCCSRLFRFWRADCGLVLQVVEMVFFERVWRIACLSSRVGNFGGGWVRRIRLREKFGTYPTHSLC